MAFSCSDVPAGIKARKKLLFFCILGYMMVMLVLYQGHTRWRDFFSHPTSPVSIFSADGTLQETIRYMFRGDNKTVRVIDVHLEHPVLGHTAELLNGSHSHRSKADSVTVAIGGGLTSKKLNGVTTANIPSKFQLFTTLLPSFCKTASKGFEYHFYFAYDSNDNFFTSQSMLEAFQRHFDDHSSKLCSSLDSIPQVHFIQCSHTASPAWAQNDAMMEAYLDGIDYFYRINDDSRLGSSGWVEKFIDSLSKYEPPNVGVVGPKHQGGNVAILTYDFVHRTHIDIFGFYYPRLFTTWWADDWVTKVYQPGRSTKLASVQMQHTMKLGQRYKVDFSVAKRVSIQIKHDKEILQRYLKSRSTTHLPPDGTKVISMSLYGNNPRYTMGAIRNAQLIPVYFPGWVLRVYTSQVLDSQRVPPRILQALRDLRVQIAYINTTQSSLDPLLWRYLVADDREVKEFLVRDADSRFSDREAEAVKDWEDSGEIFHCLRDHPPHGAIVDGLWGARSEGLRSSLWSDLGESLLRPRDTSEYIGDVWRVIQEQALCHDAFTCDVRPRSRMFPSARVDSQYVGQKFNEHQMPADELWKALKEAKTPERCLDRDKVQPTDELPAKAEKQVIPGNVEVPKVTAKVASSLVQNATKLST